MCVTILQLLQFNKPYNNLNSINSLSEGCSTQPTGEPRSIVALQIKQKFIYIFN